MPYRFFVVPFDPEAQVFQEGDFRAFIEKVAVREVKAAFFQQGGSAYWTAFVSYTGKAEQVTKPIHLNDQQLKIYEALNFCSQTPQAGRPLLRVVSRSYFQYEN